MEIKEHLNKFIEGNGKNKGRRANERYASFDYCYNYFHSFYRANRIQDLASESNLQMSCLQIGFYLASWGMLRGSSFLLEKSARNFKKLIISISEMDPVLWSIDVDNYSEENIRLLLKCRKEIIASLGEDNNPSDTLVTKIMLGVFANVPAYDQYFKKSLGVNSFNRKSLLKIKEFYDLNKVTFDSYNLYTFDFLTGSELDTKYTKAKLIDMCGFMGGQ